MGEITAHGLRHSAATILLNQVGKDLREIQELPRHKNIRTTVRYTHVGYEQTRQTAEALRRSYTPSRSIVCSTRIVLMSIREFCSSCSDNVTISCCSRLLVASSP